MRHDEDPPGGAPPGALPSGTHRWISIESGAGSSALRPSPARRTPVGRGPTAARNRVVVSIVIVALSQASGAGRVPAGRDGAVKYTIDSTSPGRCDHRPGKPRAPLRPARHRLPVRRLRRKEAGDVAALAGRLNRPQVIVLAHIGDRLGSRQPSSTARQASAVPVLPRPRRKRAPPAHS